MTATITMLPAIEPMQMLTMSFDQMSSDAYFSAPVDLDYEEPNSVVETDQIEFIVADHFVQAVNLPVIAVVVSRKPEHQLETVAAASLRRTAA